MGDFYLADKEGGREFTGWDEGIPVMFANQAAGPSAMRGSTARNSGPGRTRGTCWTEQVPGDPHSGVITATCVSFCSCPIPDPDVPVLTGLRP